MLLIIPQRYKFSSKSQHLSINWSIFVVVDYTAKVQIFEQITTQNRKQILRPKLLIIPQRYKFSSKSQLKGKWTRLCLVVDYTAKVQIFEQITTQRQRIPRSIRLLIIPQRYKFSSKSQRRTYFSLQRQVVDYTAKVQIFEQITTALVTLHNLSGCWLYRKGTNFRANHNTKQKTEIEAKVVDYTAKVQIFEQITT